MVRFIYIIVVLLALVLFTSCNSVGSTSYEQHGVYYNGRVLPSVADMRFASRSNLFIPPGQPTKPDAQKEAAWSAHIDKVVKVPQTFVLEYYPFFFGTYIESMTDYFSDIKVKSLGKTRKGGTTITRHRITLPKKGRYFIYYQGEYILLLYD
ncbi:hypothetical protein DRH29_02570 [candidate division Kazan bacterium]|uniref:Lipoprotein n=1 Tax=candidate division Kazan bacterium TaxID=2202143 RepID=A0A420ZCQ9_UNCK3|nr:MAG: hypothetical protein DRH29_02570 [candidate division Kazan bacterium]